MIKVHARRRAGCGTMGLMIDEECSASGQLVSNAGKPPTNMSCPRCGRGVATVQDLDGKWVVEVHRKMADTAARREMHRQAGL